ncbi:MAG: GxxExxY protein [Verrucomicrobiota bacterium]|nr:GxxExxY protein [Verrucomicrobiota bacterium]
MAFECREKIKVINQNQFHEIDYLVMGQVYEIHNELGRFCNEDIYQTQLSILCKNIGLKVEKEIPIHIIYKNFRKTYFLDLVVENSIIYELKTVEKLNEFHQNQLINYLLLTNVRHGKLINFTPLSVEYKFVSTSLDFQSRKRFSINNKNFEDRDSESAMLLNILTELLNNWGVFLDINLYNEALVFFLGGSEKVIHSVDIYVDKKR